MAITPTPTIAVTATPTPSAQINVSIDFVSCDYAPGAADAVLGRMTTVYANGSVSGPVDSYFPIDSSYLVAVDCGEWSNIGSMCVRKAGQPETMHWAHESGPFWYNPVDTNAKSVTIKCFNCEPWMKSATAKCL